MAEAKGMLLPSIQASNVRRALGDYLATTFALSDPPVREALRDFLDDPHGGIVRGPYVRVRLPFRQADTGWRDALGWYEGYPPYGHQAAAFRRLSSLDCGPEKPRPLPTLVTTGTGSGKTEAFLMPILDHVLRQKAKGEAGVMALILYPMNALANDQAQRIAQAISTHEALAGVTAGLFTGEADAHGRTVVTEDGLIEDRTLMRRNPPDILLTNYKMLDQMLLRPEDQQIWQASASSLQYLVLDEFHTYDGAQGTDVSMLLRRLGMALARYRGDEAPERPLGDITPVATSATLGDGGDPQAMTAFAATVFGEEMLPDAVVTETRLDWQEWASAGRELSGEPVTEGLLESLVAATGGLPERDLADASVETRERFVGDAQMTAPGAIADAVVAALWPGADVSTSEGMLDAVRRHPVIATLVEQARKPRPADTLAELLFPGDLVGEPREVQLRIRRRALDVLLGVLSVVRERAGRGALSVEVHMWLREVTRIDRAVGPDASFRWSDDPAELEAEPHFPALFCRHCGRSGWGVAMAPTGDFLDVQAGSKEIRKASLAGKKEFRALLAATTAEVQTGVVREAHEVVWLDIAQQQIHFDSPGEHSGAVAVLRLAGKDAAERAVKGECPSCQRADGIRFMGSAMATMLSVAVTSIFGDSALDLGEKKALVFTDSVQDAAHRAGFVQARAHSFSLRNAMFRSVESAGRSVTLPELAQHLVGDARRTGERYRLLAPELTERADFRPFWNDDAEGSVATARRRVQRRLQFDASLEFGLNEHIGRTLPLTGSVVAEVDAGTPARLAALARKAVDLALSEQLDDVWQMPSEERLIWWVRGVVERMRTRGAIDHPWLKRYIESDGRRIWVWGRRRRQEGMPAFPSGREAPAFPRVGASTATGSTDSRMSHLDNASSKQSWYAQWARDALATDSTNGSWLAKALFAVLADEGVLTSYVVDGHRKAYGLDPERVVLSVPRATDLEDGHHLLVCSSCGTHVPGSAETVGQLAHGPCTTARCGGTLDPTRQEENFYRTLYTAGDMRRVVAREHTSVLDDDTRLTYENGFKGSGDEPDAANVLVATPTLEMGIDIGDLSTVLLAGVPKTVANYQQRVGRAGRVTGSALVVSFVTGRSEQMPKLADPLSTIDGDVQPPSTYLNAEEILKRQFFASVVDRVAPSLEKAPRKAKDVLVSSAPDSFLGRVLDGLRGHEDAFVLEFLAAFDGYLDDWASGGLTAWASDVVDGQTELERAVHRASHDYSAEIESIGHRIKQTDKVIGELEQAVAHNASNPEAEGELRSAKAARRFLQRLRGDLFDEFWVGALERAGLLPNYTLLDDRVRLDVSLSWFEADTDEYKTESRTVDRGASNAIRELAPGATFYAQGMRISIDAVDLGANAASLQTWRFCPDCGFAKQIDPGVKDSICPRCTSSGYAEKDQVFEAAELRRVTAEVRRDEDAISDSTEDRQRTSFETFVAADLDPARREAWFVPAVGLGVSHYRDATIRWVNVGRSSGVGRDRFVAGRSAKAPLFRVCSECGHLDRQAGANNRDEHRPWCSLRGSTDDPTVALALTRTLKTEAVALRIPPALTIGDPVAAPSLEAAITLGLRNVMGGDPDHLAMMTVIEPVPGPDENPQALLIHDIVPGGTGYLSEIANPDRMRVLLEQAWRVLKDCPCQEEGRACCARCLLPYERGGTLSRASAQDALERLLAFEGGEPTAWEVETDDPGVSTDESVLEQKFRAVFIERAEKIGTVRTVPMQSRTRIEVALQGTGKTWILTPQVMLGTTKPDFVLELQGGTGVKPIAIYTDGRAFHASGTHNRVVEDADKRASLRARGFHVVAVTWDDLEPEARPVWEFEESRIRSAGSFGIANNEREFLKMTPVALLMSWMQRTGATQAAWENCARALPMIAGAVSPLAVGDATPGEIVLMHYAQEAKPGADRAWVIPRGPMALAARAGRSPQHIDAVLAIRDVGQDHSDEDYIDGWRAWLALSNILSGRETDRIQIVAESQLTGGPVSEPSLAPEWAALAESTSGQERALLGLLAEAGVDTPEVGIEVGDGIPISFAWPKQKIAVLLDAEPDDIKDVTALGWQVVEPDTEKIVHALAA